MRRHLTFLPTIPFLLTLIFTVPTLLTIITIGKNGLLLQNSQLRTRTHQRFHIHISSRFTHRSKDIIKPFKSCLTVDELRLQGRCLLFQGRDCTEIGLDFGSCSRLLGALLGWFHGTAMFAILGFCLCIKFKNN